MALYIVQHGKSLPKEADPEQGLSPEGMADVEKIAGTAKGYNIKVSRIVHSGKKRARQTAEILAAALAPEQGVSKQSGMDPLDDPTGFSGTLLSDSNMMLVGHMPFLGKLISYLITGATERPVIQLQNGGMICLERLTGNWVITWTLMPHIG